MSAPRIRKFICCWSHGSVL